MNIYKVEVFNKEDVAKIKVYFKNVNMKAKLKESDFELNDLVKEPVQEEKKCEGENCQSKKTSTLDNIIYPLYIPTNTKLSSSEVLNGENTDRVILTFSGDKNFVIVEEVSSVSDEFEIIPVFGDPLMLDEVIGAMSSNSISWSNDNISYYLVSSDLTSSEMVSVAKSLGGTKSVMSIK